MTLEHEGLKCEPVLRILWLLCNPDAQSSVWATPPPPWPSADWSRRPWASNWGNAGTALSGFARSVNFQRKEWLSR